MAGAAPPPVLPDLSAVDAEGPAAAAAALTTLAAAPRPDLAARLTSLRFAFCDVDGPALDAALSGAGRGLRALALEGTHRLADADAARLVARAGPNLEALSLYWSLGAHDAVLTAGALCPALTRLNLSGCKAVSDAALAAVADGCPALTDLDITRCPALTDGGVAAAIAAWPRLASLRAYADEALGDRTLRALGAHCPGLEAIDLCGATAVSDAGLVALATGCPRLREVGLGWVAGVGDEGVVALARHCRGLASLSLHGNRAVTGVALAALAGQSSGDGGGEAGGSPLPLTALDLMGCVGIPAEARTKEALVGLFGGRLTVFKLQR
jgi:hypothetical protein